MSTSLKQLLERGEVPNCLLLIDGKREDAIDLSKHLLGPSHVAKIDSGNHPDLHIYTPEGKSSLHPVANINSLIQEMALPPFEAKSKVFLIEEAEKMLASSSNALLKPLEDPNKDTFFLLLSSRPDLLLATIRSRLYPLRFTITKTCLIDVGTYFTLAQKQEWDRLLEKLPEENPDDFLQACLLWSSQQKNPQFFKKMSTLIEQSQEALRHNLKARTIFFHLFLKSREF